MGKMPLKSIEIPDIYSDEGFAALSRAYTIAAHRRELWKVLRWKGIPLLQFADDLAAWAECVHESRAQAVVETGAYNGGGLAFFSTIMAEVPGSVVVGVDIDTSAARRNLQAAGIKGVVMIDGSSSTPAVLEAVRTACRGKRVMVVLDSDHSADHVEKELHLLCDLVSPGSFLVCMDGIIADLADCPDHPASMRSDNPETAIRKFLSVRKDFERDPGKNRFGKSQAPGGYLKRLGGE